MEKRITKQQVQALAAKYGYTYAQVMMIVGVESSGQGFSEATGRILIQFEPSWFKRKYADWAAHKGTWVSNQVGDQATEWSAFNNAFAICGDCAMQSTSIGMMQVMGFHYQALGFKTVGAMWDFAKASEANQLELGLMFIKKNSNLNKAVLALDFPKIAYYYNGEEYERYHYDTRLQTAYQKTIKVEAALAVASKGILTRPA